MVEWVGTCSRCGRGIYCRDGFLDGVIEEDQSLVCFNCDQKEKISSSDS
ncbi:hypothetical protein [Halobacillus mangrovi]|nr:hypothetical protein [Halobacillus mangrovi]